jgi:hypothetical protein
MIRSGGNGVGPPAGPHNQSVEAASAEQVANWQKGERTTVVAEKVPGEPR